MVVVDVTAGAPAGLAVPTVKFTFFKHHPSSCSKLEDGLLHSVRGKPLVLSISSLDFSDADFSL